MPISAEFEFDGQPWLDMISKIRAKWDDVAERQTFGSIVASSVFRDIMEHFASQSGPDGPWKEWSDAYAKHMASIGKGGNMILQDKGRLRQSFTPASWRGTAEGLVFYNPAKVSGFPYAAAHNTGGKQLPKREFMWLSDHGLDNIVKIVENWLNPMNDNED